MLRLGIHEATEHLAQCQRQCFQVLHLCISTLLGTGNKYSLKRTNWSFSYFNVQKNHLKIWLMGSF